MEGKSKFFSKVALFLGTISFLLISTIFVAIFFNSLYLKELDNAVYFTVVEQNKKRLKELVDTTIFSFLAKEESVEEDLRKTVKEHVLNAYNIAWEIYRTGKRFRYSDSRIKKLIKEALRNYRFLNGKGYIFIDSVKGPVILNPFFPQVEGKNLWNFQDVYGNFVHREFENVVLYSPNHEGFVTYYWYLPGTKKVDKKVSFVKLFEPYKWIIGGGFYLSDYRNIVKDTLLKESKISSLIIVDCSLKKKSKFSKILDCSKADRYKEGVFISDDENVYYLRYFPEWNWIVGGYVSENSLVQEVAFLKKEIIPKVKGILFFASVIAVAVFVGASVALTYLFRQLYKALKEAEESNEKLRKLSEEMYRRAYTDDLTGLFNSKKLFEDIESSECSEKVFFALINIRNFREINELFGIKEGDKILLKFASLLEEVVKQIDSSIKVYRIRGDKFGILKCGEISEKEFISVVKSVIQQLEKTEFSVEDVKFRLDVVAGISKNRDNLLVEAEIAEQEAKKRNMDIYVFDGGLHEIFEEIHKNIVIANKIKDAIANDRIIPAFQPIVNLKTGEVEKYEVLMRLKDENGNFIPPGEFLPVAKKISLYPKLSRILIEKAIEVVKRKGIKVSVNISSEDLATSESKEWLISLTEDKEVAERLCFEIVETEAFSDLKVLEEFHKAIKEKGAELAIDDFGSGYSNFEYISIIKPDYIKADGSLVSKVLDSKEVEILLKHIISFAKELNIKTVAEFISSEEIKEKVVELGFDYGQGFYLGKPVFEDEL